MSELVFFSSYTSQEILNYINRKEFDPLLKVDQLNLEREKNKVFLRFGQYHPEMRNEDSVRPLYMPLFERSRSLDQM